MKLRFPSQASLRRASRWLTPLALLSMAYLVLPYPLLVVRYVGETCNYQGLDCPAGAQAVFVGADVAFVVVALAAIVWLGRIFRTLRFRIARGGGR